MNGNSRLDHMTSYRRKIARNQWQSYVCYFSYNGQLMTIPVSKLPTVRDNTDLIAACWYQSHVTLCETIAAALWRSVVCATEFMLVFDVGKS